MSAPLRLHPPVNYTDTLGLLHWLVGAIMHIDDCVDALKRQEISDQKQWDKICYWTGQVVIVGGASSCIIFLAGIITGIW